MAFNLKLEEQCLSAFDPKLKLGLNRSLADFDFADHFYCAPFEAARLSPFYKDKKNFWEKYDRFVDDSEKKSHSEFLDQKSQILSGVASYRNISYPDVSEEYIRSFANGIMLLKGFSFSFYLAAIILLVSRGKKVELNWGLDAMVCKLGLIKTKQIGDEDICSLISHQQSVVVAQFLNYLCECWPVEYEDASEALDLYWGQFFTK